MDPSEPPRDPEQWLAQAQEALKELIGEYLRNQPLGEILSLSWVSFRSLELCHAVCTAFLQAWADLLEEDA